MAEQVVVCPQCSQPVVTHCDHCDWLACTRCKVIFGHNSFIFYGEAKDEAEARKRQNGV